MKVTSYLVCHEQINEVEKFLSNFFEKETDKYNHSEWISFRLPGLGFKLSLMSGDDQAMTQNFTVEFELDSIEELNMFAQKFDEKVHSFKSTKAEIDYVFNYVSIQGPANICKVEASFSEDL